MKFNILQKGEPDLFLLIIKFMFWKSKRRDTRHMSSYLPAWHYSDLFLH